MSLDSTRLVLNGDNMLGLCDPSNLLLVLSTEEQRALFKLLWGGLVYGFVDVDRYSVFSVIDKYETFHTRGHNSRLFMDHCNMNCRLNSFVFFAVLTSGTGCHSILYKLILSQCPNANFPAWNCYWVKFWYFRGTFNCCAATCVLFITRDSVAIARICYGNSVCPSVRPSVCHTGGSVKNGWS